MKNNKLITATTKTETHLVFDVKVSIPLTEVSEELANDVVNYFNTFAFPVERYIEFFTGEDGKEKISVNVQPKILS